MIAACERWAAEHGVERMILTVADTNDGAIRLYRELGYRDYDRADAQAPSARMTFADVRRIALALPEAEEKLTWETDITFRVRDRIFAIGGEGATSVSIKADLETQAELLEMDPATFAKSAVRRAVRLDHGRPRAGRSAISSPASSGPPGAGLPRSASPRPWRTDVTTPDETLPEHVQRNRSAWDEWAPDYVANGEVSWRLGPGDEKWGVWDLPERDLRLLPDDLTGRDTIELGCGTAYVSAWLARRGARPVGVDNSAEQLATARRLQAEHGITFPLVHGNAESVPYPDASFDLVISEYGASIWADPRAWIPEAARLLRPGGRLIFLVQLDGPDALHARRGAPGDRTRCSARCAGSTASSGRATSRSTSPCRTAIGSALLTSGGFAVERLAELSPTRGRR